MTNLSGTNLNNGAAVGSEGEGRDSPSSFSAYPAYKDSGVEWLGEVPDDWESRRLKFLFSLQKRPVVDGDGIVTCFRDGAVTLRSNRRTDGFTNAEKEIGYQGIRKGDLVIHAMDAFAGAIGVSDSDGKSSPVYSACTPNEGVSAYYYARLLRHMALAGFISSLAKGIRERSTDFRWSDASEIYLPFPSISEQTQIARFLDHETARIDALIAEQQRLIELLKEKRQAVISHAVTKGLDPTVPMKDSGVEWLGEVPAHWVVRKLKNLVSVRGGSTPSKEVELYWEGEIPWVSPKDMKSERISDSIDHVSELAIKDGGLSIVRSGAVLIVVRGMILIHSVPVAITDVDVTINQDMKAMTPSAELSSDYLSLMLQGVRDAVFQYIDSSAHGTRKLEWERFELMVLPIPPHAEQVRVVRFIEGQKRAIDDLAEQAASAITLMNERRTALISAAVTGKIDVRGWQPPASTQAPEPELAEAH